MEENPTKSKKKSCDIAFKLRVLEYAENTSNWKKGSSLDIKDIQELEVNEDAIDDE